jgi:protein SCO1
MPIARFHFSQYSFEMVRFGTSMVVLLALVAACSRGREFELTGQVLAVDQARQEITIKHGDIQGFMPAMTMAYKVRDAKLLDGRVPGDLVRARLVVEDTSGYLRTLERTGHTTVSEPATLPALTLLARGQPVADAHLIDETSAPWQLAKAHGNVLAVTFIYTRCPFPNFCPLMDRQFKAVQDAVKSDSALNGHVQLLSITLDPEYDTPEILAKHAKTLKADPSIWHFATGTTEDVQKFGSQFGVSVTRTGSDVESHNLRTAVIDRNGHLVTVLNGNDWSPSDLITALRNAR